MGFDLYILDFDGTFTDAEKEAGPFFASYKEAAIKLCGATDFEAEWERALQTIRKDPGTYGWTYGGHVVAPGDADPYLRATVAMNMIFDSRGLYLDPSERTPILQNLYFENYPKADTVFRDNAREVVDTLLATGTPVFVVTNSATHDVERKLEKLAPKHRDKLVVRGDAKKYIVAGSALGDDRFMQLPSETRFPGLDRPVYLRRGHYYDLLAELWNQTETSPEGTLLSGDIYELDLAMPERLGVSVQLVEGENTPQFERAAAEASPRGGSDRDLSAVLTRAGLA